MYKIGTMVVCKNRPGNLDIYPGIIGTIIDATLTDTTFTYVYSVKYPLENAGAGPLENPITWLFVDNVPEDSLRVSYSIRDKFNGLNWDIIEDVAKRNSRTKDSYSALTFASGIKDIENACLFPKEAVDRLNKAVKSIKMPSAYPFQRIDMSDVNRACDRFMDGVDATAYSLHERLRNLLKTKERNHENMATTIPTPMKIFYRGSTTIVFWNDGTVTQVRCAEGDTFSEYSGFTAALTKKIYGTHSDIMRLVEKKRAKPNAPVVPPEKWIEIRNKNK